MSQSCALQSACTPTLETLPDLTSSGEAPSSALQSACLPTRKMLLGPALRALFAVPAPHDIGMHGMHRRPAEATFTGGLLTAQRLQAQARTRQARLSKPPLSSTAASAGFQAMACTLPLWWFSVCLHSWVAKSHTCAGQGLAGLVLREDCMSGHR